MEWKEAIETLQDIHDVAECRIKNGDSRGVVYIPAEMLEAFNVVIEESKQYHETGHTPSMVKSLIRDDIQAHKHAIEHAIRLDKYTAIGTPEECRAAVEQIKAMEKLHQHPKLPSKREG